MRNSRDPFGVPESPTSSEEEKEKHPGTSQWTTSDDTNFIPAGQTKSKLPPGVYDICASQTLGLYFSRINVIGQNLIRFPQTNIDKVVTQIQTFWEREEVFREFQLPHKRGILMWGPPGCGKSCAIQLVMRDVVSRGGIGLNFTNPNLFSYAVRTLRQIEPETPIVVLMEDLDSIIQHYHESEVLNILDGINQIDRACFLATTNYPENLGPRIVNRPSRFDKRYKIDFPDEDSRLLYLQSLVGDRELDLNLGKWVSDTKGMTFAHLKELFVGVVVLENSYNETLNDLREMSKKINSSDWEETGFTGFTAAALNESKAGF